MKPYFKGGSLELFVTAVLPNLLGKLRLGFGVQDFGLRILDSGFMAYPSTPNPCSDLSYRDLDHLTFDPLGYSVTLFPALELVRSSVTLLPTLSPAFHEYSHSSVTFHPTLAHLRAKHGKNTNQSSKPSPEQNKVRQFVRSICDRKVIPIKSMALMGKTHKSRTLYS